MDCPICYEKIKFSAIGTCTHHFCLNCLISWCNNGGEYCPICKTRIEMIRRDLEFDKLNGNLDIEVDNVASTLKINFLKDTEAGITLQNNYSLINFGNRAPGVRVCKIDKTKQCYKDGLKYGDIILFINNIPCLNHKQVINIFNNAIISNQTVNLILKRKI